MQREPRAGPGQVHLVILRKAAKRNPGSHRANQRVRSGPTVSSAFHPAEAAFISRRILGRALYDYIGRLYYYLECFVIEFSYIIYYTLSFICVSCAFIYSISYPSIYVDLLYLISFIFVFTK